jgi:hypothetical protein
MLPARYAHRANLSRAARKLISSQQALRTFTTLLEALNRHYGSSANPNLLDLVPFGALISPDQKSSPNI